MDQKAGRFKHGREKNQNHLGENEPRACKARTPSSSPDAIVGPRPSSMTLSQLVFLSNMAEEGNSNVKKLQASHANVMHMWEVSSLPILN